VFLPRVSRVRKQMQSIYNKMNRKIRGGKGRDPQLVCCTPFAMRSCNMMNKRNREGKEVKGEEVGRKKKSKRKMKGIPVKASQSDGITKKPPM
jgi:hypothetical protein